MVECFLLTELGPSLTYPTVTSHGTIVSLYALYCAGNVCCSCCFRRQNMKGLAKAAKHLVVVAGHSVTVSGHLEDAGLDEHDWYLLEYQKHKGLPQAILGHIRAGIAAASKDPNSLLVLSGGQTRALTGPDSEGASYYRVADAMNLWAEADSSSSSAKSDNTVRARTVSEDFATDSFENLYVHSVMFASKHMKCSHHRYLRAECSPFAGSTR
jgi:hypothetical protein